MKNLAAARPLNLLATLFLLLRTAVAPAQTVQFVRPGQTDPRITQFNNYHLIYLNTNVTPRGELFVFLPGTTGTPAGYTNVGLAAANLGFHSVGLMYPDGVTMNSLCSDSTNPDCYAEARLAVINGGTNAELAVSAADCITNRLFQLIRYLAANDPGGNWSQFLDANSLLPWPKIVIAGHSQGAGHAGLIAKMYPVARCLMFADTDWWTPGGTRPGQPAPWITNAGVTEPEYYFGFVHTNDPLIPFAEEIPTWAGYGLGTFGGPSLISTNTVPAGGSHELITGLMPDHFSGPQDYHGATVVDSAIPLMPDGSPVYLPAWQFMMAGPPELPKLAATPMPGGLVQLSFATFTNYTYQVQSAASLTGSWNNVRDPIAGAGSMTHFSVPGTNTQQFYRVFVEF
jgi:hypothetical protein